MVEELTKDEIMIIIKIISNTPLNGTVETLPAVLTQLNQIISKLTLQIDPNKEE